MITVLRWVLLGVVLSLASGCGSDSGTPAPGVSYSGLTSQATITTANALSLSVVPFETAQFGSSVSRAGLKSSRSPAPVPGPALLRIWNVLNKSLSASLAATAGSGSPALAGGTITRTTRGTYAGTAAYTFKVTVDGSFSGTSTYLGYQDSALDPPVSGTAGVSGTLDSVAGTVTSMTLNFSPLTATVDGSSIRLYGTMSLLDAARLSFTLSCLLQDQTGTVYWLRDWICSTDSVGNTMVTGLFYDPADGYIVISTPIPLSGTTAGGDPTAGTLNFAGASGTSAEIVYGSNGYTVNICTATGTNMTRVGNQWIDTTLMPLPFAFPDKSISVADAVSGSDVDSDAVIIQGSNPNGWPISYTDTSSVGSILLINGTLYLGGPGLPRVHSGDRIQIFQTPATVVGGTSITSVTIGGYTAQFKTTTVP